MKYRCKSNGVVIETTSIILGDWERIEEVKEEKPKPKPRKKRTTKKES